MILLCIYEGETATKKHYTDFRHTQHICNTNTYTVSTHDISCYSRTCIQIYTCIHPHVYMHTSSATAQTPLNIQSSRSIILAAAAWHHFKTSYTKSAFIPAPCQWSICVYTARDHTRNTHRATLVRECKSFVHATACLEEPAPDRYSKKKERKSITQSMFMQEVTEQG